MNEAQILNYRKWCCWRCRHCIGEKVSQGIYENTKLADAGSQIVHFIWEVRLSIWALGQPDGERR